MKAVLIFDRHIRFLIISLFYFFICFPFLEKIQANFDEGVYVAQSKEVSSGKVPYRDFICHQTPFYIFLVAAWDKIVPANKGLLPYRFLSLLIMLLCGIVLYQVTLVVSPPRYAYLSPALFFLSNISNHGLLAMPNSLTLLFSLVGILFFVRSEKGLSLLKSILFFSVSFYTKPIALPSILSTYFIFLFSRSDLRKKLMFTLIAIISLVLPFMILDLWSRGGILDIFVTQFDRISGQHGIDLMANYRIFSDYIEVFKIRSGTDFSLHTLREAFFVNKLTNSNFFLVLLWLFALCLLIIYPFFFRMSKRARCFQLLMIIGPLFHLTFAIWIWNPFWEHYLILFVPYLMVPIAWSFFQLGTRSQTLSKFLAPIEIALISLFIFFKISSLTLMQDERFEKLESKIEGFQSIFSMNPTVPFLLKRDPACGFIDPLNNYGPYSLAGISKNNKVRSFLLSDDFVIRCLVKDSQIPIFVDSWLLSLTTLKLLDQLRRLPNSRFIFLDEKVRREFEITNIK